MKDENILLAIAFIFGLFFGFLLVLQYPLIIGGKKLLTKALQSGKSLLEQKKQNLNGKNQSNETHSNLSKSL